MVTVIWHTCVCESVSKVKNIKIFQKIYRYIQWKFRYSSNVYIKPTFTGLKAKNLDLHVFLQTSFTTCVLFVYSIACDGTWLYWVKMTFTIDTLTTGLETGRPRPSHAWYVGVSNYRLWISLCGPPHNDCMVNHLLQAHFKPYSPSALNSVYRHINAPSNLCWIQWYQIWDSSGSEQLVKCFITYSSLEVRFPLFCSSTCF